MDLIIFGGQSNMEGQTSYAPEDLRPVVGAMEYKYNAHAYGPLQHPSGDDIPPYLGAACYGWGSMVPDFCDVYRKYRRVNVAAVHVTKGATTIDQWMPEGGIYTAAKLKIDEAIRFAPEPLEHRYYIWLQGESDAIRQLSEDEYYEKLIVYKNYLKRDFGIDKFGIIRVGYFNYNEPWKDEAIMNAQERVCRDDEDFLMLTRITATLSHDKRYLNPKASGHYDNDGLAVIAAEAARTLAMYTQGLAE